MEAHREHGLKRWAAGLAARAAGVLVHHRARHELKALDGGPAATQNLRAFIQINVHPSPR